MTPAQWRLCQLDAAQWRQPVSPSRCKRILRHCDQYCQIERDNHNLIWLYTLMLQNDVELPHGEVVSAMKKRLLEEETLTPLAWRYLANGTADNFRAVLNAQDPGEEPQWRWHTLRAWLQVLSGLRLRSPIQEPIQELFLHDGLVVEPNCGEVLFRGAWMKFSTLRHILEEAEKRLTATTLAEFAKTELVEVITWLASTGSILDQSQTRHKWKYLAKQATEWKADIVSTAYYRHLTWESALPQIQIDHWTIFPVTDAWSLRRLAISQHNCGDMYIESCLNDEGRIFKVGDFKNKTVATIRLVRKESSWIVGDIRGFANAVVPDKLSRLGEDVARRYLEIERNSRASPLAPVCT